MVSKISTRERFSSTASSKRAAAVAVACLVAFAFGPGEASSAMAQEEDAAVAVAQEEESETAEPNTDTVFPLPRPITSFGATKIGEVIYAYGGNIDSPHEYYKGCQSGQLLKLDLSVDEPKWEVISEDEEVQGTALVAHGKSLYRVGGFTALNPQGEEQDLHSLDSVKRFDTATGKWEALPSLPMGRSSHDAYVIGDQLYVVGGWDMNGDDKTIWHDTALVCDLSEDELKWEELPAPGFERRAIALSQEGECLVVAGGMTSDEETTTAVSFYDPQAKAWKDGPKVPGKPLDGFGAAAGTLDGKTYVSMMNGKTYCLADDKESWELVDETTAGRFFHRILPVGERLISIGGTSMQTGKYEACDWIEIKE